MNELRISLAALSAFTTVYLLCHGASASIKSKAGAFLCGVAVALFLLVIPLALIAGDTAGLIQGPAGEIAKKAGGLLFGVVGLGGIFYFPLAGYKKLSAVIYLLAVVGFHIVFRLISH